MKKLFTFPHHEIKIKNKKLNMMWHKTDRKVSMKIYTRKMMMTRMNFYEERERETAKAWQKHKKKNE